MERPSPCLRHPSPARAGEGKGRGKVPLNPRLTPWTRLCRSCGAIFREAMLQNARLDIAPRQDEEPQSLAGKTLRYPFPLWRRRVGAGGALKGRG